MNIYTYEELVQLVKDTDAAIAAAIQNKSYELDTGQGRQKVSRQDLQQLRQQREYWISELEAFSQNGLMRVGNCRFK